jgi:predicted class III extradiol MEMO1 family dioxygenase
LIYIFIPSPKQEKKHFAIAPHYLIATEYIDQFYQKLQTEVVANPKHIVIISPNHFGL